MAGRVGRLLKRGMSKSKYFSLILFISIIGLVTVRLTGQIHYVALVSSFCG